MAGLTLRVLGTSVTLLKEVHSLARRDLDFDLEFEVRSGVEVLQKGILSPDGYDIYDQWFNGIDLLWTSGAIQPIRSDRLELWEKVGGLTKTGALADGVSLGAGSRPMDVQFVQEDGTLGSSQTSLLSAVPTAHNADSFSYDPNLMPDALDAGAESWGWLLNETWRGKVGMNTDPSVGIADMILASKAMNFVEFEDIGNLSIEEIDALGGRTDPAQEGGAFRRVSGRRSKNQSTTCFTARAASAESGLPQRRRCGHAMPRFASPRRSRDTALGIPACAFPPVCRRKRSTRRINT